ncbi:MAG: nuclear transport factor 2 family protein [Acidobacteriota bacterium]|nr:nuclear transport factor 2 family protein [Acidobacteriota bacterium]
MKLVYKRFSAVLAILIICFCGTLSAQNTRDRVTRGVGGCSEASAINGFYRIDVAASDKLYSVIEGASSNVPYGEQMQFFNDLAVRLTPPDLLAVECRGNRVSLGSSRARRVEFVADGVIHNARYTDGSVVRSRISFERGSLIFNSSGRSDDNLSFTFAPIDSGKRLRVTRRISAKELVEPVVINTIYNKITSVARWDIYGEQPPADTQVAKQNNSNSRISPNPPTRSAVNESGSADTLRQSLNQWIEATNRRNIEKQMSFYMPQLQAFYLSRNASRDSVRIEKNRAFATAKSIDIRAAEPEIIFQDGGRKAIMRFRKKYNIESGAKSRSGEVVQELRWQRAGGGWKIFSERDIRVIR